MDDTCYFVGSHDSAEAELLHELCNADVTGRFLKATLFSDSKRPVTADVLNRIDVKKVAEALGREDALTAFLHAGAVESNGQGLLAFEKSAEYVKFSPEYS